MPPLRRGQGERATKRMSESVTTPLLAARNVVIRPYSVLPSPPSGETSKPSIIERKRIGKCLNISSS